jgi:predicted Rossmann fold nucleotide-binding protein DprA/Smf involved in DNA uptake
MKDDARISNALLSRLSSPPVRPLTSREFWNLASTTPLFELPGHSDGALSEKFGIHADIATRIPELLGRGRALALATEEFEHAGFWVITGDDERYPVRLRERLRDAAPAILYGVGNAALLDIDGLGVVGSRDIPHESIEVARTVAGIASANGLPVVSGGARGVDQHAMNAAFEAGGTVVGAIADSLIRVASGSSMRHAIADERVCLVTPYSPHAPFSAGNAMGRNKIIYALSRGVVVVRSDKGSGGTWAGATEALSKDYAVVHSWTGPGAGPGNEALLALGALALAPEDDLSAKLLAESTLTPSAETRESAPLTLF